MQSHQHVPTERSHPIFILNRILSTLLFASLLAGAAIPGSVSASSSQRPISLLTTREGRTIRIIGGHFIPGATVTIALLNTRTWHVISTGTVRSEGAVFACPLEVNPMCGRPDPNAGKLYFQTTLRQRVNRSALAVVYRSGNHVGIARVQ